MVRINLVEPKRLADQHLIAEYNEILMLLGYVSKYPRSKVIPDRYCLGKGHILFFKNKLFYLKKRHEAIKKEMRKRGFVTNIDIDLTKYSKGLINDWKPKKDDFSLIKRRLIEKIKKKPQYYRYYSKNRPVSFFISLLATA